MAALSSFAKFSNLKVGMELYLEGKFGTDNPIVIETYFDTMGQKHVLRLRPEGKGVFVTQVIDEDWLERAKTGFEFRLSDETITALMLLIG